MARLGHPGVQPQPAVRPVYDRAACGRLAAQSDAGPANRHRLQSESHGHRRNRRHRRGIPRRVRRRPARNHLDRLARPDRGVRPLSRPQVRSDLAARLLPAVRVLQQRGGEGHDRARRSSARDGRHLAGAKGGARPTNHRATGRGGAFRRPRESVAAEDGRVGDVGRERTAAAPTRCDRAGGFRAGGEEGAEIHFRRTAARR